MYCKCVSILMSKRTIVNIVKPWNPYDQGSVDIAVTAEEFVGFS